MRPPAGRTIPEILLSLPALQLSRETYELLAPLLTESVQEAGSAVSGGGRGQYACGVGTFARLDSNMCRRQMRTPKAVKEKTSGGGWQLVNIEMI